MEDTVKVIKVDKDTQYTGIFVEYTSKNAKSYQRLKKRAEKNGWSVGKETLIEAIIDIVPRVVDMPCGESISLDTLDDIPDEDLLCSCGNPNHHFVRYENSEKGED